MLITLPKEIKKRLDKLVQTTGHTKNVFVREAVLEHIEDLEDAYIAAKRLKRVVKCYSIDEVEKELGLKN